MRSVFFAGLLIPVAASAQVGASGRVFSLITGDNTTSDGVFSTANDLSAWTLNESVSVNGGGGAAATAVLVDVRPGRARFSADLTASGTTGPAAWQGSSASIEFRYSWFDAVTFSDLTRPQGQLLTVGVSLRLHVTGGYVPGLETAFAPTMTSSLRVGSNGFYGTGTANWTLGGADSNFANFTVQVPNRTAIGFSGAGSIENRFIQTSGSTSSARMTIDASNTANVSFTLPSGTSVSSASGYGYLPVPEPATVTVIGLGLAFARRRTSPKRFVRA